MTLKESIEVQPAISIMAYLNSFDGDVEKWKDSFYQVWRYQLSWSFAYDIQLEESRRSGVFLRMVIKPEKKSNVLDVLESLGYRNVQVDPENIGVIEYVSDEFLDQFIDVVVVE